MDELVTAHDNPDVGGARAVDGEKDQIACPDLFLSDGHSCAELLTDPPRQGNTVLTGTHPV